MSLQANKQQKRERRHVRIRARIFGTSARPRLAAHKSNTAIVAQLIDDEQGRTLAYVASRNMKAARGKTRTQAARLVGAELAKIAQKLKIDRAVYDRGGFIYTGIIKEVAEGAREGGLTI